MNPTELKPCPFCGSGNLRLEYIERNRSLGDGVYWVRCLGCDLEAPGRSSEIKAVEYWNGRVIIGLDVQQLDGSVTVKQNTSTVESGALLVGVRLSSIGG